MSDLEANEIERTPALTVRLSNPSTILGIVLLRLTCLPMARCNDEEIVPARMAMQFAGYYDDEPIQLVSLALSISYLRPIDLMHAGRGAEESGG